MTEKVSGNVKRFPNARMLYDGIYGKIRITYAASSNLR